MKNVNNASQIAGILALIVLIFSLVGQSDYTTDLEIERDQLRQQVSRLRTDVIYLYDKSQACSRVEGGSHD